jgi:hypothetical protein
MAKHGGTQVEVGGSQLAADLEQVFAFKTVSEK